MARGFSLLEMLAVLAILAIITMAVLPATSSLAKSTSLGTATQSLSDEINLCRTTAAGRNQPVDFCFLRKQNSTNELYEQVRSRILEQDGTFRWISRIRRMPEGVAIAGSKTLSNAIGFQDATVNADGDSEICLRFYPSAEVVLLSPGSEAFTEFARFFTVAAKADLERSPNTLPKNFATIQVDTRNSSVTIHRP